MNYERAVRLNSHNDEALFNLAVCLFTQGNFHEAQVHANRAIALSPNNQAYTDIGAELKKKLTPTYA